MSRHAIASLTAFERWVKAYREGGPEALRPRPKGRPRKSGAVLPKTTREQGQKD